MRPSVPARQRQYVNHLILRGVALLPILLLSACGLNENVFVLDVRKGDLAAVSRHLASGASPDSTSRSGWPVLVEAAFADRTEVVLRLLQARAKVDQSNPNGFTALHEAAKRGNVKLASELLRQGARIDALTQDGWTALHWATYMGHAQVASFLLEHGGATADAVDKAGKSSLMHAVERGRTAVALLLIRHGADVNRRSGTDDMPEYPLLAAVSGPKPDLELVRALLGAGANLEAAGWNNDTPLCRAARLGNSDVALHLVKAGAQVDVIGSYYQKTPLMFAADSGNLELVKALLKAGATIQGEAGDRHFDAMESALRSQRYEILELLLRAGGKPAQLTDSGKTVMDLATESGDALAIALLTR